MLQFPAAPVVGEIVPPQSPSPYTYQWNGVLWEIYQGIAAGVAPSGGGEYELFAEVPLLTSTDIEDVTFTLDPDADYEFQFLGSYPSANQSRLIFQLSPNGTNWDVGNDYMSQLVGQDSTPFYATVNLGGAGYMSEVQQNSGNQNRAPATVSGWMMNHGVASQHTVMFGTTTSYGQQGSKFVMGTYSSRLNTPRVDAAIRFGWGQNIGTGVPEGFNNNGLLRVYQRLRTQP